MKWRRFSRATKLLSRILNFENFKKSKIFNFIFFLFKNFPPQNQNFQKPYNMLEDNAW